MTLKTSFNQVVETLVINNSSFQNYTHPDDHTIQTIFLIYFDSFPLKKTYFLKYSSGSTTSEEHQGVPFFPGWDLHCVLRSAHTMRLVPATSRRDQSQGLVATCELATSPCD